MISPAPSARWTPGPLRRWIARRAFARATRAARKADWPAVLEACRQGLGWDRANTAGWIAMAEAFDAQGRPAKAAEMLAEAARLASPRDGEPFHRLGLMRRMAGDFEGALAAFQEALKRDPKHAAALQAADALAPIAARRARAADTRPKSGPLARKQAG